MTHRAPVFLSIASAALAFGAAFFAPSDAAACGGCFAPPENPTVVTDHRMALSISNRAYALSTGSVALSGNSRELLADERVKALYLGGEM